MTLRHRAASGMLQLGARHLLGLLFSIASIGLVLRYLTAAEYGKVVLAQSVWFFFSSIASGGLDAYVIRCREEISSAGLRRIYSASLLLSVIMFGVWLGVASLTITDPVTRKVVQLMGFTYLIRAAAVIPSAVMEAELRFAPGGAAELAGQIVYVLLLATLLRSDATVEGIVWAQTASASIATGAILWRARLTPAPSPFGPEVKSGLRFGLGFQTSVWLWQSKDVLAPMVITWAAGPALLGMLGMATQITQRLLFFRQIVWRVGAATISRMKGDREKVAFAVQLGADAQASALGVVLLGISVLLCVLESRTGSRWLGVSRIFPAVAFGVYANSLFSVGCSALFSGGRVGALTAFHALYVALFLGVLATLRVVPGVGGYYAAEIVACAAYFYLYGVISRHVAPLNLSYPAVVGALVLVAMGVGSAGGQAWPIFTAAIAIVALGALPRSRRIVEILATEVRGSFTRVSVR